MGARRLPPPGGHDASPLRAPSPVQPCPGPLPWNLRLRIFCRMRVVSFLELPSLSVSFSAMAYSSTPSWKQPATRFICTRGAHVSAASSTRPHTPGHSPGWPLHTQTWPRHLDTAPRGSPMPGHGPDTTPSMPGHGPDMVQHGWTRPYMPGYGCPHLNTTVTPPCPMPEHGPDMVTHT